MTSEDATERFRRLHPLSPVFEVGRSFLAIVLPGLVVLFLAAGDRHEAWYMLAFVPAVAHSLTRYFTLRYRLTAEHVVLREGLFFRKTRHIPYARIQNIDTVQNPLHRLLGVAEVLLETASGKEPEAVLRVLSLRRLEEIRAGVFGGRAGDPGVHADEVPTRAAASPRGAEAARRARAFFRMRPVDVFLFGLLSQRGLALLGGLVFAIWEFELWERLEGWIGVDATALALAAPGWAVAVAVFCLLLLLQVLTVGWAFLTLHDFHIARSDEDLSTTCGLWTHQSATLPRHRIQFLSVRESLLHRLTGRLAIRILTAGGDSEQRSRISRKYLVPLVERSRLGDILCEVQPDVSFAGVAWSPVHPRARRRMFVRWMVLFLVPVLYSTRHVGWWAFVALLPLALVADGLARARARRLGYAVTDSAILLRDGVLTHVRNAVRFAKIQSVSLTRSPFDRRHGTATLHVDTAGVADFLSFAIPYVELRVARRLMNRLRREASAVAFRW